MLHVDEIELHFKRSLSQAARRKLALEESSKVSIGINRSMLLYKYFYLMSEFCIMHV